MAKTISNQSENCVRCGAATITERVFCVEVRDFHCGDPKCGYKDMRVIQPPVYDPTLVKKMIRGVLDLSFDPFDLDETTYAQLKQISLTIHELEGTLEKIMLPGDPDRCST